MYEQKKKGGGSSDGYASAAQLTSANCSGVASKIYTDKLSLMHKKNIEMTDT